MEASQEVLVCEEIAARRDRVWDLVGDFAGVMRWHPQVVACDVEGAGPGLIRKVHFADWWIAERLDGWDRASNSLAYTVIDSSRPGAAGASAIIRLSTIPPRATQFWWRVRLPPGTTRSQAETMTDYYHLRINHLRKVLGLIAD